MLNELWLYNIQSILSDDEDSRKCRVEKRMKECLEKGKLSNGNIAKRELVKEASLLNDL